MSTATEVDRVAAVNEALKQIIPTSQIERRRGGWYVRCYDGRWRRWATSRGQDFYPVWSYGKLATGGTGTTALSQLIRWAAGKPVLPLSTFRYWVKVGLPDVTAILAEAGYPENPPCVVCGNELDGLDWWNLDGVSGPCCEMGRGCQKTSVDRTEGGGQANE